jgi:hypothetical protein
MKIYLDWAQGLITIYKHVQGRTPFFTPARFKSCLFFKFLLNIQNPVSNGKTQRVPNFRFFIGGAVTFTLGPWSSLLRRIPDKNDRCAFTRDSRGEVMIFLEKNKVLRVGNNRRNNKLKKMDSIQEKALKIHCMDKSKIFSFHFKSSRLFNDV